MWNESLNDLQNRAFEIADKKGFHGNWTGSRYDCLALLALVHSEVSEAVQEVKRHWPMDPAQEPTDELRAKIADELADVLIRVFDFGGLISVDLQEAVQQKMFENEHRPHLYGTPGAAK